MPLPPTIECPPPTIEYSTLTTQYTHTEWLVYWSLLSLDLLSVLFAFNNLMTVMTLRALNYVTIFLILLYV